MLYIYFWNCRFHSRECYLYGIFWTLLLHQVILKINSQYIWDQITPMGITQSNNSHWKVTDDNRLWIMNEAISILKLNFNNFNFFLLYASYNTFVDDQDYLAYPIVTLSSGHCCYCAYHKKTWSCISALYTRAK